MTKSATNSVKSVCLSLSVSLSLASTTRTVHAFSVGELSASQQISCGIAHGIILWRKFSHKNFHCIKDSQLIPKTLLLHDRTFPYRVRTIHIISVCVVVNSLWILSYCLARRNIKQSYVSSVKSVRIVVASLGTQIRRIYTNTNLQIVNTKI